MDDVFVLQDSEEFDFSKDASCVGDVFEQIGDFLNRDFLTWNQST